MFSMLTAHIIDIMRTACYNSVAFMTVLYQGGYNDRNQSGLHGAW